MKVQGRFIINSPGFAKKKVGHFSNRVVGLYSLNETSEHHINDFHFISAILLQLEKLSSQDNELKAYSNFTLYMPAMLPTFYVILRTVFMENYVPDALKLYQDILFPRLSSS